MYIEGLDELDNKIIEVVKENARLTYSEIESGLFLIWKPPRNVSRI